MKSPARRLPRAIAACFAFLTLSAFLDHGASARFDSSCTTLSRWAHAYRGTSPSLNEIAKFDRPHRIAIFNVVRPEVRAALWRAHLHRVVQGNALSETQRALLEEAIVLTTRQAYERDPTATAAFDRFWARAEPAFNLQEHRRIWFDLGSTRDAKAPSIKSPLEWFTRPYRANAQDPTCECNGSYGMYECLNGCISPDGCEGWVGCGPEGRWICNGLCRP